MKTKLKVNNPKIIVIIFLLIICSIFTYNQYYKIEISEYSEIRAGGVYFSPNNNYSIMINKLIPRDNNNEYYIMGRLVKTEYIAENHQLISNKNSKIIYWKKMIGESIDTSIYVEWITDNKVQIEDKVLNIKYDRYDYRRDIKRWFHKWPKI